MKKEEVRAAVESEIGKFSASFSKLTVSEVQAIHAEQVARFGAAAALQATRTEVSAALQLRNPVPHALPKDQADIVVSHEDRKSQHDECRATVPDGHVILSEQARMLSPSGAHWSHADAHHFVQKLHGQAIWREVDRVIAESGVK